MDALDEHERLRMCVRGSEIEAVSNTERKIRFIRNGKTGKSTLYTMKFVDTWENVTGNSDAYTTPVFACPTEPPLYIHVQKLAHKIWVIVEESELLPSCNNANIHALRVVKKITNGWLNNRKLKISGIGVFIQFFVTFWFQSIYYNHRLTPTLNILRLI